MGTMTSDELRKFVNDVLESIEITDEDLNRTRAKSESVAHRKIIEAFCNEWNRRFRVYPQSDFEGMKIDFLGRQNALGRILLAVEVDTTDKDRSWLKLADINAVCKIWVRLDYKWDRQFPSEAARKQAWENWLNGRDPEYPATPIDKVTRFWYSYGPTCGDLTIFVKSPDYLGSKTISSLP